MHDRLYFVYIMASRSGVLYIGVTNSIRRRSLEHKSRDSDTFTAKHRCTRLVWYEVHRSPSVAIAREKQLKGWTRAKKFALIEIMNPLWFDLSEHWSPPPSTSSDSDCKPGNIPLTLRRQIK
jgi:putative endonuclease